MPHEFEHLEQSLTSQDLEEGEFVLIAMNVHIKECEGSAGFDFHVNGEVGVAGFICGGCGYSLSVSVKNVIFIAGVLDMMEMDLIE